MPSWKTVLILVLNFLVLAAANSILNLLLSPRNSWIVVLFVIPILIFSQWGKLSLKKLPNAAQWVIGVAIVVIPAAGIVFLAIRRPTPEPRALEAAELAPFVVVESESQYVRGRELTRTRYGVAAILRLKSSQPHKPVYVRRLDVIGDVAVDCAHYEYAFIKEGDLVGSYEKQCIECKPFYRISWVAWPLPENLAQAPSDERFIKFVIVEPDSLGGRLSAAPARDYIGCEAGSGNPKFLTTVPNLRDLVYFTAVGGGEPKRPVGPRLRKEVADGGVQFRIELGSQPVDIQRNAIRKLREISSQEWNAALPQELFYATDIWERATPVTKDPLMDNSTLQ